MEYNWGMCVNYKAPSDSEQYRSEYETEPPSDLGRFDVWPGYAAGFIRRHPHADVGDEAVPEREALTGLFGMVPHWAKDTSGAKRTYNARTETVAEKPSFRDAWRKAQHCIIPAEAFVEPDWRSGRAVPTMIGRADGKPMGIAGLWTSWRSDKGETVHSFTMLTINAGDHPLMNQFHKPTDEKRMVVILPEDRYGDWLRASPDQSWEFLNPYPAERLMTRAPQQAAQLF